MNRKSLKTFLKPYSILQKRKTTISHAFASAATPVVKCDDEKMTKALNFLGQDPNGDLQCIYCNGQAETWDHLVSLVKKGEIRDLGYGHQLGNLVPCCKACNSRKRHTDFNEFVRDPKLVKLLKKYQQRFGRPINLRRCEKKMKEEWIRYKNLREKIFGLMQRADKIASKLREGYVQ